VSGQVRQGRIRRSLTDHQMDRDQALEDDGPGRVPQAILQGPEHLADAGFARMCRDEDVLDVFALRRRGLEDGQSCQPSAPDWHVATAQQTLILVAPLTDFSKELAMAPGSAQERRAASWEYRDDSGREHTRERSRSDAHGGKSG